MNISRILTKRRIVIILVWAVILLALIPAYTGYSHFIDYSTSSSSSAHSESGTAQNIINSKFPDNSSLIVAVNTSGVNPESAAFSEKILNYQNNISRLNLKDFSSTSSIYSVYESILANEMGKANATSYIDKNGIVNAPASLKSEYTAKNLTLVYITFNVASGKSVSDGKTASEIAFPSVNKLTESTFGNAYVTGNGAIAYETSQATAKAGFAFGLIFIFLAIAVLFALWSWKSSILVFIFSGIALLLGYVAEFITGLIFHHVSYIVNYTLTAVILGISADYLIFIISRYRDELRSGKSHNEAIDTAIKRSGKSIVISGITVAFSLLTFYFIPGFKSWGITLFLAVIFTIALETILLPAVVSLFGKKLFMKRFMTDLNDSGIQKSKFYKIADKSVSKKIMVVIIVVIIGALGFYSFLTVPTSYNFNTGLPQNLEAVKGLNAIDDNFGESQLYPVYAIVNTSGLSNINSSLHSDALFLLDTPGIEKVSGPFINKNNISSTSNLSEFTINKHYTYFTAYMDYNPYSGNALHTVKHIRSNDNFIVGGLTSTIIDEKHQNTLIYSELEILIVVAIGIIIGISFRSWKYPLISLTGVLFSVSWATSILYFISVYVLHEALIYLIPIILFIILFSLGNDYTVFIISRIRESAEINKRDEAIKRGIATSGKTVTTLGLILAVSLGSLALIPVAFLEQLGIAFIISLIIDTFIIRTVYFPAMISLLFRENKKKA